MAFDRAKDANYLQMGQISAETKALWDFFICHVREDQEQIARPLAEALNSRGLMAWYADYCLKPGDSLGASISYGLARSKFGIVIISNQFLKNNWAQEDLNALATREVNGEKVILPIWHNVGFRDVFEYSPILADRVAISTKKGLDYVMQRILESIKQGIEK